jgi:hypothetical protein
MTATTLPADLADGRRQFLEITGLSGDDIGALPDASHKKGGGYHCGCQDIKDIGKWGTAGSSSADYSVRQTRDRIGGNACSAIDVGDNWPRGGRAAWIRFNNLLVTQMRAKDPDLAALRAVNFTPDGVSRKRYDSNNPGAGIVPSTDTVDGHTHLEWWRNTAGTTARARSIARICQIMRAAIYNTALEVATMGSEWHTGEPNGPFLTQGNSGYAGQQRDTAAAFTYQAAVEGRADIAEVLAIVKELSVANPDIDDDDIESIRAAARQGALEGIQAGTSDLVAAILAALPEPSIPAGGDVPAGYTLDQLEEAVREAIGTAELSVGFKGAGSN